VGRYNADKVYINENTEQILASINKWVESKPWPKVSNQVDDTYYCIDIGCSTDVALMSKHYDWQKVFNFFNSSIPAKSTFATKYPTMFDVDKYHLVPGKHRIRVSLMPQIFSDILEPGTDKISNRIDCIPNLQTIMEVHINFSPIVYVGGWLDEYRKLFEEIKSKGIDVKCECIFLTYNTIQHERNPDHVNELLWRPDIQEHKDSQYAPDNIRYQYKLKSKMVKEFTELYVEYFNPENIRYIF
jgi:hypothetical protein